MRGIGYGALFYQEGDSVGVVFPDLDGCVTVGRDIKEAVLRAEEALGLHLDGMRDAGYAAPNATMPLDDLKIDPPDAGDEGVLVGRLWIVPRLDRSVRVTITMNESLLAEVDQFVASQKGKTRSGLIAEGARRLLNEAAAE